MGYGHLINGIKMTGKMIKWVERRGRKSSTHMRRKNQSGEKSRSKKTERKALRKKFENLCRKGYPAFSEFVLPLCWCEGFLIDVHGSTINVSRWLERLAQEGRSRRPHNSRK